MKERPTTQQVLAQLERIEASALFAKSPKKKHLLRFIVESALEHKAISEKDIGPVVFPPFDPEQNPVRVQALNVRKRLEEYYEKLGKGDLVEIGIEPGAGYEAEFSYSDRSEVLTHVKKAIAHRNRLWFGLFNGALFEIFLVCRDAPEFAPGHALYAEIDVIQKVVWGIFGISKPTSIYHTDDAEAKQSVQLDANLCFGHIMLGTHSLLSLNWSAARDSFNTAMKIDRVMTEMSLWYALYLLVIGKTRKALEIAKINVKEHPDGRGVWLVYSLFLYLTRNYEEARDAASEVSVIAGPLRRLQELLMGLIFMELRDYGKALGYFEAASATTGREWHTVNLEWKLLRKEKDFVLRRARCIGFMCLCLARSGQHDRLRKRLDELNRLYAVSDAVEIRPMQRALIYMACGGGHRALTALRIACLRGDAFVLGLHLCPFLDQLRDHPRFIRLMERFQPPQQKN